MPDTCETCRANIARFEAKLAEAEQRYRWGLEHGRGDNYDLGRKAGLADALEILRETGHD